MSTLTLPAAKILLNEVLPLEALIARKIIEHTLMPKGKVAISVIELRVIHDGKSTFYEVTKATGMTGGFGKGRTKHATLSKALLDYNEKY